MPPQAPSGTLNNPRYPTFYACYLLQSLQIPGSAKTYIGSTPNPVRRLRQHNGEIEGGAKKTRNGRPWDMIMIVHGFPTKTAALQFEWAWQHPHKSRYLKGANGDALAGRGRALSGNIRTVRLMVNTIPYSTWPLHVKLFSPEAAAAWNKAAKTYPALPLGFTSAVELEGVDGKKASIHVGSGRTGPIDIHDAAFTTQHLAATSVVRASSKTVTCTVCEETIDFEKADPLMVALCPTACCHAVSHITCLSVSFVSQERSDAIIPRGGSCSRCHKWVLWGDIIRGADRRKFGAQTAEEDEETTDGENDESDSGVDHTESDAPDLFPVPKKSKSTCRATQESVKKVAVTAKGSAPASKRARKNTAPEIEAEKPRRGRPPKASQAKPARGAPYSTSALNPALVDGEFEDFSPLIDQVPDVTDEDWSDDVAKALSVPAAGWQPEILLVLLPATTMKLWSVLGIFSIAFARNPQIFEITATKFADGSCELHQWRPTQLHKDVTETSSVYLERQYLPANSEGTGGELLKIYGHEEQAMLRLLEEECITTRSSEPHIPPGSSPQLIFGNEITHFKPLPSPPPLKLTSLLFSGPSDNRIDLVFFADGYTAEEESKFLADAERLALDISANQTFATVKPLLNIWAAFTPSNETGIGTQKERKDTAFGLYRVGTELRAIYCGKKPVARAACASLGTGCDYPILLANSPHYGGLGGEFSISTASTLNGALVLRHELGHSIIKVGEEYDGGYAYFGPNSAHSIKKPHIKWQSWLSDPSRLSKDGIVPEHAISPLQAYPWTLLNHSDPYTAFFNSSGTYSSHMIRFSLSGLPKNTDLLVLLDEVDVRWEPRPEVGTDRWHYDILRDTALSAGTHNLTFSLGASATEGLAQLCSFEIIEYGNATQFNTTVGNIGAYPTFSMWNGTTYRPTNEGCLMRQVVLPQFCKPCSEGLWLQLLKRVDLIDQVEVIWDVSRENVTVHLTSVGLGQFRADTSPHQESLEFSWALNGTLLSQFNNKTTIILPYAEATGSWEAFATFRTEEVQMDPKGYLKNSKVFFI